MVYFTKISSPANENIIGLLVRGHANYAKKDKGAFYRLSAAADY